MFRQFAIILLVTLAACGAPTASTPSFTAQPTNLFLPTLPPAAPTLLQSDLGKGAPTLAPAQEGQVSTPVPTNPPPPSPAAINYNHALRPEFAAELDHVINKTVYTMDWEFNPDLTEMQGTQRVIFANNTGTPLNEIYFRLFANYPNGGGRIDVTSVQSRGRALSTQLEQQDTALRVQLERPLNPDQIIVLNLDYTIQIPSDNFVRYGDFTRMDWITTLPTIYPIIPAYDENGWHTEIPPPYGDLVNADSSAYDVTITTPLEYKAIASGQLIEEFQSNGQMTRRFIAAPMRDFDLNLTDALISQSSQVGDIAINSWSLPAHSEGGRQALDWTNYAVQVFGDRFGPYPFKELDVVEAPTSAGGIEYPGVFTIATRLYDDPGQVTFFEFATVHETAHQWFYSLVGSDQINNPWLDEALAQYATLVYFEDRYGPDAGRNILENFFDPQYEAAKDRFGDMPAGLPVGSYDEDAYAAFVYAKGPRFLQAVRDQIGDEAFFAGMRQYVQDFKYRNATPDDLVNAFNTASGQDITPLYRQWITGS